MCEIWEEIRRDGKQEGKIEGKIENSITNLKSLMQNLNLTIDEAMNLLNIEDHLRNEIKVLMK